MSEVRSTTTGRQSRYLGVRIAAIAVAAAALTWQWGHLGDVWASDPLDEAVSPPGGAPSTFAELIEGVKPAVVNISTTASMRAAFPGRTPGSPFPPGSPFEDFLRRFFERQSWPQTEENAPVARGMGSGFIIDADGHIVTNHHVIKQAESIQVVMNDGERYDAVLVGSDPKTDLALLKIDADGLPHVRFGDSDATRVGDWVVAIGNPFGLGGSATAGIVSARGRDIRSGPFDDFLQVDAPINRGNSGGPLFDLSGKVIGVNTAIYSPNGGNVGIGFAIPARQATTIIDQLRTSGRVERGWLGVQIQAVTEEIAAGLGLDEARGALVAGVAPDSPAERAGLRTGDVILRLGGNEVDDVKSLIRQVADAGPDGESTIEVWRSGTIEQLDVTLGENTDSKKVAAAHGGSHDGVPVGNLGLTLAELDAEARQRYQIDEEIEGALVVDVAPKSAAAKAGIRRGDVVVMVGQTPVSGPEEVHEQIERITGDERSSVVLQVAQGEARRFVAIPLA